IGLLPISGDAINAYLMAHPNIVAAMEEKALDQEDAADDAASQRAVDKLGLKAFFDPRLAYITGPPDAKRTIVEFFDYNCPHCRHSLPALKKFYEAHKNDTRFAFIEYPFEGPNSTLAARAALAARKQPDKYLAFYFAIMGSEYVASADLIKEEAEKAGIDYAKLQHDMDAPDVAAAIARAHSLGDAANISGTPMFIVNGKVHEGDLDDATLKQMIRS
ncbi:MAG TPA: thioredoxin domain-containing protein, partial [Rhizomicrobium sp.]|nr:thioredoxin domain-containing protein [Rhizomicrobium sp.]